MLICGSFFSADLQSLSSFADGLIEFDEIRQRYFVPAPVQSFLRKQAEALPTEVYATWARKFLEYFANLLARANEFYVQGRDGGLRLFDLERHNVSTQFLLSLSIACCVLIIFTM